VNEQQKTLGVELEDLKKQAELDAKVKKLHEKEAKAA
jgi:hypothetical protein